MKNNICIRFLLLFMVLLSSCNYLDIVPDERPTEEDAFKDKKSAENYLYSCYAFLPAERKSNILYQSGEVVTDFVVPLFVQGNHTAANPGDFQFWSRMYGGIKRCYQLINNVDKVPRLEEDLKVLYKAEAKFLIAYFHFYLLKSYGPVLIVDKEFGTDMSVSDFPKRATFDESVDWIASLFDEASKDMVEKQGDTYFGRATSVTAKALKGRLLMYAASPLFNGNSKFYSTSLLDPDTQKPLMNLTYDPNKWEKAFTACQEAVTVAEKAGFVLYKSAPADNEYPSNPTEYSIRMAFIDRKNKEVIWADTRKEDFYSLQNECTPRDPNNDGASWNGVSPSLKTVKNFYTENGLPIKEDPAYFKESEYFNIGKYEGENTCNLHLKREPRFYAWISFHNGWYEMQRDGKQRFRTMYRGKDPQGRGGMTRNYSMSGYLLKKVVGPSYDTQNGYPNYPWPLVRMVELYLNYAETAVETGKLDIAMEYLNKVRVRAGIPTVQNSWKGIATLDQKKLREIVRKERTIELFFESHFVWDKRRWLDMEDVLGHNPEGLNINGVTDAEFFKPVEIKKSWKFTSPANYLLPISDKEININRKIVQNPGY